mgnify:FL=1
MFGTNTIGSTFSLTRVLGGISKGLSIANQVIPLYQQAKPMIQNARKVISVLGELNKSNNNSNNTNNNNKTTVEVTSKEKTETIKVQPSNSPVFFQ